MDSNGALLAVVARGDPEELRNALGGECNLEVRDEKGKSVLDLAALLGKAAALRVLVENGALVNGCNKSGTRFAGAVYFVKSRALLSRRIRCIALERSLGPTRLSEGTGCTGSTP